MAQATNVASFSRAVLRSGLGAPLLVLMLLAMVVLPMPPFLLDILFTFNISLSLIILLVTIYTLRPLDFAAFPTILLIATLLRLALNVASTRVVLLHGHTGPGAAGHVIKSFGEFVVGGNYAVGIVVFVILVIINFAVVTKGAGRISEVSARFTLDAMPGKQMAIDADLIAGLIDADEARRRLQARVADRRVDRLDARRGAEAGGAALLGRAADAARALRTVEVERRAACTGRDRPGMEGVRLGVRPERRRVGRCCGRRGEHGGNVAAVPVGTATAR